jgi:putative transposase
MKLSLPQTPSGAEILAIRGHAPQRRGHAQDHRSHPSRPFSSFRTRIDLQLEVAAPRHQVQVLRRGSRSRVRLTRLDRALWVLLYRLWPRCLDAVVIVKPETVVRWHRLGFRALWSWKSRPRGPGRPSAPPDIKNLIRCISRDNVLWGAPRIHGELLELGTAISQAAVSKYMMRPS